MKKLICPMCGSKKIETINDKQCKCKDCGCSFYVPKKLNLLEVKK